MCVDFDVRDNRRWTFSLEETLLWLMDSYFSALMMDLFLTNMQLLFQDINWWTAVVWITCLDSHSDGTHSLQSIHCWASGAMLHFSKSDDETHLYHLWSEGKHIFQQMFISGWTIPLNDVITHVYMTCLCSYSEVVEYLIKFSNQASPSDTAALHLSLKDTSLTTGGSARLIGTFSVE